MGRKKGVLNKDKSNLPYYATLTVKQRITLLADLITDHIEADQNSDKKIFAYINEKSHAD